MAPDPLAVVEAIDRLLRLSGSLSPNQTTRLKLISIHQAAVRKLADEWYEAFVRRI